MALHDGTPEQVEQFHRERRMEHDHMERRIAEAVAKERERCARVLDDLAEDQDLKIKDFEEWGFDELAVICAGHRDDYKKIAAKIRGGEK